MTDTTIDLATEAVERILQRVANDLTLITDRNLALHEVEVESATTRPAGAATIHISFRLGFAGGHQRFHGCLLVPLAEAISLAGYMMMASDENVRERRSETSLDEVTKDTMLELANFVAGAADAGLRALGIDGLKAGSEGCQGVRPDVRPAFPFEEGDELLVGRAVFSLHEFPEFEAILVLPAAALRGDE